MTLPSTSLRHFVIVAAALILASDGRAAEDACPPIEGLAAVIGEGRVLLLGEIHGTAEGPAFVSALTCHALRTGFSVTVALELPQGEEETLVAFLDSSGSHQDRAKVLALPFWSKSYQDGRSSRGMLELLADLRTRRQAGNALRLILLDQPSEFSRRDEEMAKKLLAAVNESPTDFLVALTGNIHNRTDSGSGRMGARVRMALGAARVVALNMSHTGGTAWICEATQGCGPLKLRGRGKGSAMRVKLFSEPEAERHQGVFHVGSITASPPAREPEASR